MNRWDIQYKGHTIRIENSARQQRVFVDGELQDELYGLGIRSRMYGVIRENDEAGKEIMVSLGGFWKVICRVFVDKRLVFHSNPDDTAAQEIRQNTDT